MKKIFLFLSAILCFSASYGQTLQTTATVTSGSQVVLTASGESSSGRITAIQIILPESVFTPTGTSVSTTNPEYADQPYPIGSATKFKFTVTGNFGTPAAAIIAKLKIRCTIQDQNGGNSRTVDQTVTITVNPVVPTSFQNQVRSQTFYKNDCPTGLESDPYTYSVPAGKYTASTQAAANALANAEIAANGQNAANAALICKQVYYNTEVSATFTKNNCGPNLTPTAVNYIVPANKHKSLISQVDAGAKAQADINANGQNYANTNGTCIAVPYIEGPDRPYTTVDYTYFVGNRSPGETYEWMIPTNFTVIGGLNNFTITLVPKRAGTAPNPRTLQVKITKSTGEVVTISKVVTIIYCLNCPI